MTTEQVCHGCGGRGWVDTATGPYVCPLCFGSGKYGGSPIYPYHPYYYPVYYPIYYPPIHWCCNK